MLTEQITNRTMPELFELLLIHTKKLLALLNHRNPNGIMIHQEKTDIQLIQSTIEKRKTELSLLSLSPISRT